MINRTNTKLSPGWQEVTKENESKLSPGWKEKSQITEKQPISLKDLFELKNTGIPLFKNPEYEDIKSGAKQGFKESLSALPEIGKYMPQPGMPKENQGLLSDYNLGRYAGSVPTMAAIATPLAAGGEAIGIPAILSQMGAAGTAGALTTQGGGFERGLGALSGMLPIGAAKALFRAPSVLKTLFTSLKPEKYVKDVQNAHDVLSKSSSDLFDFVKDEAKLKGFNKIEDPKIESIIDEASAHFPKKASAKLLEKAKQGDYEALHQIQSDLGTEGTKQLSHDKLSERNIGREMLYLRSQINKSIENFFDKKGQDYLSSILRNARGKFKELKETYYKHPDISKMVHPDIRLEPKNPMNVFTEKSKKMDTLISKHPEIGEAVKLHNDKNELFKVLKHAGIGATVGTGGTLGGMAALKYIFDKNPSNNEPYDLDQGQGT